MRILLLVLTMFLTSCSALSGLAIDAAVGAVGGGSDGGINTELVVGDKEQVLGNNIEVKADKVDKVVGESDNSVNVKGAVDMVEVININYPTWLIVLLMVTNLIFWTLDSPSRLKTQFLNWRNK